MCYTEIEHLSWCDVRPWITIEPFTDDGTGDTVDPFHVERHICHRTLYGPPSAQHSDFEPCDSHTCCLTLSTVDPCKYAPVSTLDPTSCPNFYVAHTYSHLPSDVLPQFGRPSWLVSPFLFPFTVYSPFQKVDIGDDRRQHQRQAFFQAARQLYLSKKKCIASRNEVHRVVAEVEALSDQRSYEERDAAFTRYCLDQLAPLKTCAANAVAEVRAIPELTLHVFQSILDVVVLVQGPNHGEDLLLEMSRCSPSGQIPWLLAKFTGPLLDIQEALDLIGEITCRLEVHHESLTGMMYEGSTGTS